MVLYFFPPGPPGPPAPPVITYVCVAISESAIPDLMAMALMVMDLSTLISLSYFFEFAVGVDPSVVYLIVAPLVAQDNLTFCFDEYVPP